MVMKESIEKRCEWLRKKVGEAKAQGLVVGLSGGIDSSLTAALSYKAFGKDRITGLILPCFSSEEDQQDAQLVAETIGMKANLVCLDKAYEVMIELVGDSEKRMTKANIKSRLRMVALYAIANERNYLVAGTSNKSEIMTGYYTKYGDGGVDLEPISDLYKSQVYEMARYLGIPERICQRPPSACLWEGQTDEEELGMSYDTLELALRAIEGEVDGDLLPQGLKQTDYLRVQEIVATTQHKREMPPTFG